LRGRARRLRRPRRGARGRRGRGHLSPLLGARDGRGRGRARLRARACAPGDGGGLVDGHRGRARSRSRGHPVGGPRGAPARSAPARRAPGARRGARRRPGVSARASHGRGAERRRLAGRPGRPLRGRAPAVGAMPAPYRGVLFDLFGTLVGFDAGRLPELEVDGVRHRTTVGGLGPALAEWVPGVSRADFARALLAVSDELARARAVDHVEWPSRERFRRALARVGCAPGALSEAAVDLSRAHMAFIAAATVLPPAHAELLAALRPRYRLGLVSNFDDTGTAYGILVRHGIARWFDTVVISEGLGLRKPHPAVARAGLRGLGLAAGEALLVGDTYGEDVAGARAAGLDAAWIDARGQGVPEGAAPPRYVLRALPALAALL